MKKISIVAICITMLSMTISTNANNQIPDKKISANNPYIKMSQRAMAVAWNRMDVKKQKGDEFWLTWGYTAPESTRKGDKKLKEKALLFTEITMKKLEAKPDSYWTLIPALKTIDFWINSKEIDNKKIKLWLKQLRPSVEKCYSSQNGDSWLVVAPNVLHQAAAALRLASVVYAKVLPNDPDLIPWQKQAKMCMGKSMKQQLRGGAFSYIRSSGPDPCYYNFDSTFIGIYYLLTKDENARMSLEKMAGWSRSATICGWLTAFSSPWWKHIWGTGGPYFGPEIIAAVSKDPLTCGVMKKRRQYSQPYYYTYYAMRFYKQASKIQAISDRCEFDANANGVALRRGGLDIVMPFRSWCDSTGGASFSDKKRVISYINAISLIPMLSKNINLQASYSITHVDKYAKRASLVGKDWIAQAVTFLPVKARYGDLPKGERPWRRTDIYFADKNGSTAYIEIKCLKNNKCQDIALLARVSKKFSSSGLKLNDSNFSINVIGSLTPFNNFKIRKWNFFAARVKNAGKRLYRKGEVFNAKISITLKNAEVLSIGKASVKNGIYIVPVLKGDKTICTLVYNATAKQVIYRVTKSRKKVTIPAFKMVRVKK